LVLLYYFIYLPVIVGVVGGAVGWGTVLQAGRLRWLHWPNPSGRTMALGSTQPLTEANTRDISWGVKATSVTFMCWLSGNSGSLNLLKPWGPVTFILFVIAT